MTTSFTPTFILNRIGIILLFILMGSGINQVPAQTQLTPHQKTAYRHIINLKTGALLVLLDTKSLAIDKLKKKNKINRATELESETRLHNEQIYLAIKEHYDFSEVYFFSEKYIPVIANGYLDQVVFLNEKLEEDRSIKPQKINYLILVHDYQSNISYSRTQSKSKINKDRGISGLIIKSEAFDPLSDPFPFFQNDMAYIQITSFTKLVTTLNTRFNTFYQEAKPFVNQLD